EQVTCSRLGVSLRRPTFNTGVGLLWRGAPGPKGTGNHHPDDGSNGVILQLTKEWPEQNSQSAPVEQAQNPTPHQKREKKMNEVGSASFAIRMRPPSSRNISTRNNSSARRARALSGCAEESSNASVPPMASGRLRSCRRNGSRRCSIVSRRTRRAAI